MTHEIRIDGKMAILNTRASTAVLMMVAKLEGRRKWLVGGGLSFEPSRRNLDIIREAFPGIVVNDPAKAKQEAEWEAFAAATPYTPKTPPMPHQARILPALRKIRHSGVFMEQGTGKTWVSLLIAGERFTSGQIDALLIVTRKGVHRQWVEAQIPRHAAFPFSATVWPKVAPFQLGDGKLHVFAINIDGLKTAKGIKAVSHFYDQHRSVMMVVDESQEIKNKRSQRWMACNKFGQRSAFRMAMTGTPIAKNLEDEWAQLSWVDDDIIGIRYMGAFRNEFCIMGGYEGKAVVGSKNIERFKEITAPYIIRVTKEEIGILPKQYDPWHFDLTAHQKRLIRDLKVDEHAVVNGADIYVTVPAALPMKIQQISNGFVIDEDRNVHRLYDVDGDGSDNPRIAALFELIEDHEGKIVIWCRFREDCRAVTTSLNRRWPGSAVQYNGGTKTEERKASLDSFINGDARFFVSNPSAGGTGIDGLQTVCQVAVYFSNSDNSIERWQSEDRTHRIGTIGQARYYDMFAKGSADAAILRRQRQNKAFASMVLDDIRADLDDDDEWHEPESDSHREMRDLISGYEVHNAEDWES